MVRALVESLVMVGMVRGQSGFLEPTRLPKTLVMVVMLRMPMVVMVVVMMMMTTMVTMAVSVMKTMMMLWNNFKFAPELNVQAKNGPSAKM